MAAAGGYLALTVALTWPVLADPSGHLIGDERGSVWRALWTGLTTGERLRQGAWPFVSDRLAWPVGVVYSTPSPVADLLFAALHPLVGVVATWNLIVVAHLLLACAGAHLLARQTGLGTPGAWVAGTAFGFNAALLTGGLASGCPEVLAMAWLPWTLTALLRFLDRPGPTWALATIAAFLVMAMSDPNLGLLAPLALPALLLPSLTGRPAPGTPSRVTRLMWLLGLLAAGYALFSALLDPLLSVADLPVADSPPGTAARTELPPPDAVGSAGHLFGTLTGLFLPGKADLQVHQGATLTLLSGYLGWFVLLLAGLGARLGRLRWLVVAVFGALIATGPYLLIAADSWRPAPLSFWVALREALPALQNVTVYARASAVTALAVAMLAGAGLETLLRARWSPGLRLAAGALAVAAITAELVFVSPVPFPIPSSATAVPQSIYRLKAAEQPGAVIEWPVRKESGRAKTQRSLYHQTIHGRPIFSHLGAGPSRSGVENNPFFAYLERLSYGDTYRSEAWTGVSTVAPEAGVTELAGMGYAWLAYHPWEVDPARRDAVNIYLSTLLRPVEIMADGSVLFAIQAGGAQASAR